VGDVDAALDAIGKAHDTLLYVATIWLPQPYGNQMVASRPLRPARRFRGIGVALARGLLPAGASVVLNARDAGRLDAARRSLTPVAEANDARVYAIAFDVTDPDADHRAHRRGLGSDTARSSTSTATASPASPM
jgi:hypothetical protein